MVKCLISGPARVGMIDIRLKTRNPMASLAFTTRVFYA